MAPRKAAAAKKPKARAAKKSATRKRKPKPDKYAIEALHSKAWLATVEALFAAKRIDASHQSAVTQGAVLSAQLDLTPRHEDAPKWHSELRQVRRELMGDDDDDGDVNELPGAQLIQQLANLGAGRTDQA